MSDDNDFQNLYYIEKVTPNKYLNSTSNFKKSESYDHNNMYSRDDIKNTISSRQNIKYVDFVADRSSSTTEWKEVVIKEEWIDIIETEKNKCAFCSKVFSCSNDLKNHERKHKENFIDEKIMISDYYLCSVCNKTFFNIWALKIHVCDEYTIYFNTEEENIVRPYKCAPCQRSYSTPWALQIHVCKNQSIVTSNKRKLKTLEKQSYKCKLCNKRFLYSNAFASHKCVTDEEITYRCTFCNKYFVESLYNLHKQLHIEQANTVKSLLQTLQ